MAKYDEMVAAAEAIKAIVPLGYGMTWQEAKGYALVALDAAERIRQENQKGARSR